MKNPIAIGRKKDLWANLDNEFWQILDIWRWHKSKLMDINIKTLPYYIALSMRYLTERHEADPQPVFLLSGV